MQTANPARAALSRAVNAAIAAGAPVYVNQAPEQAFEAALDNAAHAALAQFEALGIPEKGTDELSDLLTDLNMAIESVMRQRL